MQKALWLDSINKEKIIKYKKLEGGVSSEVYHVKTNKNEYCVKRSLRKLLVKKKWIANTSRIKFEYYWLNHCRNILNKNIPKTYEFNNKKKYIVMEYLNNSKYKTLKELYFKKIVKLSTIRSISKHLYKIHSKSNNYKTKKIFQGNNLNKYVIDYKSHTVRALERYIEDNSANEVLASVNAISGKTALVGEPWASAILLKISDALFCFKFF